MELFPKYIGRTTRYDELPDRLKQELRERATVKTFLIHRCYRSRKQTRELGLTELYSAYEQWCRHLRIPQTVRSRKELRLELNRLRIPRTGFGEGQRYYLFFRKNPFA